jgi:hypothetical protein
MKKSTEGSEGDGNIFAPLSQAEEAADRPDFVLKPVFKKWYRGHLDNDQIQLCKNILAALLRFRSLTVLVTDMSEKNNWRMNLLFLFFSFYLLFLLCS